MTELTKGLNPPQKEAVLRSYKQPTMLMAGAGSGKTSVLTKRIAYMLEKGVTPSKILAVTFTNKAAREMKERISKLVGDKKATQLNMGTFHSLCVKWLHQYYTAAGLNKGWTIFSSEDTNTVIKEACQDLGYDDSKKNIFFYKSVISNAKNDMLSPFAYEQKHGRENGDVANVYKRYQDKLNQMNGCDFDDLIFRVVKMLGAHPDIRMKFQRKYKYIMCDEFQDTNSAQYALIDYIVGDIDVTNNNLFVVGDDYQSIYGWRGAQIKNFLTFMDKYPTAKVIKLEQNYRSTKTIVEAGNHIIANNVNQSDKVCFSGGKKGSKIKIHSAEDDVLEAAFVAEEIYNLVEFGGYKYEDIAILFRTNVQSRLLEDQMIKKRIPYNLVSGFSFYERKEIKDILAWLQVSINPKNDVATKRLLTNAEGIGRTTVQNIIDKQKGSSLIETMGRVKLRTTKANASLAFLVSTVSDISHRYSIGSAVSSTPISDMLDIILRSTNYIERLKSDGTDESQGRINNIQELCSMAKDFEEDNTGSTIDDFLNQISLQSQADNLDEDRVQMMTMHTSKGLEYSAVFIVGLEEGLFPHSNSLGTPELLEEERRLAYVGVTRAKRDLYLCHAQRRRDYSRKYNVTRPSRFLEEIPKRMVEQV